MEPRAKADRGGARPGVVDQTKGQLALSMALCGSALAIVLFTLLSIPPGLSAGEVAVALTTMVGVGGFVALFGVLAFGRFRTSVAFQVERGIATLPRYHWWSPARCAIPANEVQLVCFRQPARTISDIEAALGSAGRPLSRSERRMIELPWSGMVLLVTRNRAFMVPRELLPAPFAMAAALPRAKVLH